MALTLLFQNRIGNYSAVLPSFCNRNGDAGGVVFTKTTPRYFAGRWAAASGVGVAWGVGRVVSGVRGRGGRAWEGPAGVRLIVSRVVGDQMQHE